MKTLTKETKELIKDIPNGDVMRVALATKYFFYYCRIYMNDKFKLDPADFHLDIFNTLVGVEKFIAIMGFRGSAKSTILEAFAEWNIVTGKTRFSIWIGATGSDATSSIGNIRSSIEENVLLQSDFGIVIEKKRSKTGTEKWNDGQLTIKGNTILARSRGQKVRGLKFGSERIGLIIVDDLEDVESTRTMEKRKKTREWFFTEVVPATKQGVLGDDVKVVMLGNLVHRDCLIAYLVNNPDIVKVHKFALFNGEEKIENITWPALYPTMEAVNEEKKKVMLSGKGMGHIIWQREYLLKLVDEEDQVIKREDIQYYPVEWLQKPQLQGGVGVDLAISKKQTADYTAMTKGVNVNNDYGERRLLILPNNVKARLDFSQTIEKAKELKAIMKVGSTFFVEKVAYQQSAIEVLEKNGIFCKPMTVTTDKRSRLIAVSSWIKSGMVLFPKEGADDIIEELINFGIDEHDDQVDSLVHLINGMLGGNTIVLA